ncbi:MAG: type I secretion system permease/ATPase [Azospira sp.]|jgi:ATP-binding cassette subfamily C exporter for protease/lipase|nr:type I secretion system permease/ATPase [Azospira sp.]
MSRPTAAPPELASETNALRRFLRRLLALGLLCSLLSLTPSFYMLQVYERVVNSRDGMTLLMLTVLALGLYAMLEILEWVREQIMHHGALEFDERLSRRVFDAAFAAGLRTGRPHFQALRDFRSFADFLGSRAMLALLDAPFSLLYLLLVFLMHPMLGAVTLAALLGQVAITWRAEIKTQKPLSEANQAGIAAQTYVGNTLRNAQVIESMGMTRPIYQQWLKHQEEMLLKQAEASDHAGANSAASKFLQQTLSSSLLALGVVYALQGTLTGGAGMMIVASIIGAKALAPLVQLVTQWKSLVNARDAYARLDKLLAAFPAQPEGMSLPRPQGQLSVEGVVAGAPGSQVPILRGVNFALNAGEALAVVGPSASGKTTLARLLVGVWPTLSGKVRLDGADVFAWNKGELGPAVGYLPQGIELFDGTLAENIARFGEADPALLEEAVSLAGLNELIDSLPDGLETVIGEEGGFLSGGQRQRVALARAIYGRPSLVVLDEPNANLDQNGEQALLRTLATLKSRGTTLVLITHRTSVLPVTDRMLVLRDGQVQLFGPRDEVLAKLSGNAVPASAVPATAPVAPSAA